MSTGQSTDDYSVFRCQKCGELCEEVRIEEDELVTEMYGVRQIDRWVVYLSPCCNAVSDPIE